MSEAQFNRMTKFDTELTAGSVKAATSAVGAKSSDLWKIKPTDITVLPDYNPRLPSPTSEKRLRELVDSIKANGFYQDKPLAAYVAVVNGEQIIYLQDGHRRLQAVLIAIEEGAPIETVPVVMKDRSSNMVDLQVALLESNDGEPFTALEKAIIAARFKAMGMEDKLIAEKMRCTPTYVAQLLSLAGAPKKIRDMVQNGEISATNAIETLRKEGDGAVEALSASVEKAKAKGKAKATSKDGGTPAELKLKFQKHYAKEAWQVLRDIFDSKETQVPDPMYTTAEKLLYGCDAFANGDRPLKVASLDKPEKVKKEPKPKAEPKPKVAKAPKAPAKKAAPKKAAK